MVKLSEIYRIANDIAPKSLSDELCEKYGYYDNSGILVDTGDEIQSVLFSLDLSSAAIDKAIEKGCNLILTHHPAIYGKIFKICFDDESLLGGKLVRCLKNGISVISMHLNLDAAKEGIDESLMEGVKLSACKNSGAGTSRTENNECVIMNTLACGGYGRAYGIAEIELGLLSRQLKETFQTDRVETYGNKERRIKRVASFCGSGADEAAVVFAKSQKADAILSSDFKHHILTFATELGMAVITLTHYASENYGFEKFYQKIRRQISVDCVYHVDEELL